MRIKQMIAGIVATLLTVTLAAAKDECKAVYGESKNIFSLATGSPGELGMLKELADVFNERNNSSLCWVKAGSGKSLKLLKEKKVDVVMVHAPAAEMEAVDEGWAIKRTLIGSNEFYLVGPAGDPAGVSAAASAAEAYGKIAAAEKQFLSRGDNSGTHKKEISIWNKAGIVPGGQWYITTKDFMMATLKRANDVGGYFMTDSSTWVAGKKNLNNLRVLFRGDPVLINTYHGLCQPPGATAGQELAQKFIDFLASEEAQLLIGTYGNAMYGEPMYSDARYAEQYDH